MLSVDYSLSFISILFPEQSLHQMCNQQLWLLTTSQNQPSPYSSPPQLNSLLFNTHSYSPTQLLLKPNIPLPNSFYPTFPIHKSPYQTFPYPTFSFTPFPIYSHIPMHNSTTQHSPTQHSPLHHSQYTATYLCITQLPNIPLPNILLYSIPNIQPHTYA